MPVTTSGSSSTGRLRDISRADGTDAATTEAPVVSSATTNVSTAAATAPALPPPAKSIANASTPKLDAPQGRQVTTTPTPPTPPTNDLSGLQTGQGTRERARVSELQRLLGQLGFGAPAADGLYGPVTARSVRAFSAAHGLSGDGTKITPQIATELAFQQQLVAQLEAVRSRLGAGGELDSEVEGWKHDSLLVAALQTTLEEAGFLSRPGWQRGTYDETTAQAVRAFAGSHAAQKSDGSIDAKVLLTAALQERDKLEAKRHLQAASHDREVARLLFDADNPRATHLLRLALADLGFLSPEDADAAPATATGTWGAATEAAVRAVARSESLRSDGKSISPELAQRLVIALNRFADTPPEALPILEGCLSENRESTTLHRGVTESGAVIELQTALIRLGLLKDNLATGTYGTRTQAAVAAFAAREGLGAIDGAVVTHEVAISLVRKIVALEDTERRTGAAVLTVTRELCRKYPERANQIFTDAEAIRALPETEKAAAIRRNFAELRQFISGVQANLSQEAKSAWDDFAPQFEQGLASDDAVANAAWTYEFYLTAMLAGLEGTGDPEHDPALREWFARLEHTLNEVEADDKPATLVTGDMLQAIVGGMSLEKATLYAPQLNLAMAEFGITTRIQQAAFIAQLAHESGGFRYLREVGDGSGQALVAYFNAKYSNRADLGNRGGDDGYQFRGRGFIQLTGRENYARASRELFTDNPNLLLKSPDEAAKPEVAFRIAGWYWRSRNLNAVTADGGVSAFRAITRSINGGYNGWEDRLRYYQAARQELATGGAPLTPS